MLPYISRVEKSLLRYYVIVRVVALLIMIALRLFPDHNADAFNPIVRVWKNRIDSIIHDLFDGYRKWDSIYFSFIAQWNYLYEQTLAFFPLWPCLLSGVSRVVHLCFSAVLQLDTIILLVGIVLNFIFGLIICVLLFRLGFIVLGSVKVSYFAAVLFCLNPALVFFSSLYSESLFLLCTLSALIAYERGRLLLSSFLIALSVASRSNGLLNVGYIGFALLCSDAFSKLIWSERLILDTKRSFTKLIGSIFRWWLFLALTILPYVMFAIICVIPLLAYQVYAFLLFCLDNVPFYDLTATFPKPSNSLIEFGNLSGYQFARWVYANYTLPPNPLPSWCLSNLPFSYSHIQKNYWNVDLFGYYELKQIPNFVLACPVVILSLACASTFYGRAPNAYKTLGIRAESPRDRRLLPYILHMLFLTVYGMTHINVQVLTRIIFSSCPVIYWFCAYMLCDCPTWQLETVTEPAHSKQVDKTPNVHSSRLLHTLRADLSWLCSVFNPAVCCTRKQQTILLYFVSYALAGTVLHSKFLPWT